MIPQSVKVVILADRGFGRTALATFCRRHGFGYVIRIKPSVTVRLKGFRGQLLDYPVFKGIAKVLKRVSYRSDGAVTQHVVVRWRKGLPAKRDECWFLMTDQPGTARQLCKLYGKRMTTEQLFRDGKSKRNGRGGLALPLEPARHAGQHARAAGPAAADPGGRVPAAVRRRAAGQATVRPVGVVLDEPRERVQHLHDRADHAGQGGRQPAAGVGRRRGALGIGRAKLGMSQRPGGLTGGGRRAYCCPQCREGGVIIGCVGVWTCPGTDSTQ